MDQAGKIVAFGQRFLGRLTKRGVAVLGLASTLEETRASRWYLVLECLPGMSAALCARVLLGDILGLQVFSGDTISSFSNSAIFVVAIMLAGVLEDYKESEGAPAELASQFDAISEAIEVGALLSRKVECEGQDGITALDARELHQELLTLLDGTFEFLAGLRDDTDLLAMLTTHSKYTATSLASHAGSGVEAGDVMGHYNDMRCLLLRMHVIKRTDFLSSGYSLMEMLVWITLAMSVLGSYDSAREAYISIALTALQFLYVMALLRDIDDPFDWAPEKLFPVVVRDLSDSEEEGEEGEEKGSDEFEPPNTPTVQQEGVGATAEIDCYPLLNVYARVARLAGVRIGRAAPPTAQDMLRPDGSLRPPSEILAGQGGKAVAAQRAAYSVKLREAMVSAWDEADTLPAESPEDEELSLRGSFLKEGKAANPLVKKKA